MGVNSNLYEYVKEHIDGMLQIHSLTDSELYESIENTVRENAYMFDSYLSISDRVNIVNSVYNSIRGFGILDSIMSDDSITEVMINGYDSVFVEKKGKITKHKEKFESEDNLYNIVQRIVGNNGREVNQANPIVDSRLPDGSRVNVVLSPISLDGTVVTIRKFSKEPMTVEKLIEYGSIDESVANFLMNIVKAKYNIFIAGSTGSGKTTFLNALTNFIPKDERIITIEDSAELQIAGIENLVRLETRNANTSGIGELTIRDLIRSALRMRPERIIVGEVRGKEALDMLQAMNTGHDGSISTGHANSSIDMISRLETMVLSSSDNLPIQAIRKQIASAIDIVIFLSRLRDKSRKVTEISEIKGIENGEIVLNKLYEFVEDKQRDEESITGKLCRTKNAFINQKKLQNAGIDIIV